MIESLQINNQIVYYQDFFFRWVAAIGKSVRQWILGPGIACDDTTGDPDVMTVTVVEAGTGDSTIVNATTAGYNVLITTAANEYDGVNAQVKGEAFKLESGKPLSFRAKVKASDATQSDLLIGLCETKTDLLLTTGSHGITATNVEGVFFYKKDGATTIAAKSYKDGAEVATANSAAAFSTNDVLLEIYWDGTTAYFYHDGVLVTSTTAIPDGDLTLSVNFRAGSAGIKTLLISDFQAIQVA